MGSAKAKEGSFMWDHTLKHHGGTVGGKSDYTITITGTHSTPLDRIMDEAVRIRKLESDAELEPDKISLNGKTEYFKPEYYTSSYRKGPRSED